MSTIFEPAASGLPIKFLGGTVLSFNATIGYGSQQESTLNVEMVADCANGQPDTITIETGSPQYFIADGFKFGGLINSWNKSQSMSGKVYSVKMVDPRQLLENVTIIVDSARGAIDDPNSAINNVANSRGINYFNVYSFFEDATAIVNGEPNDCYAFGSAMVNDQGMPYSRIIEGLKLMGPTIYSTTGFQFTIDFDSFPVGLPYYYRVPGPNITLMQLLQDVCDVLGYDFYVYMDEGTGNNQGANLIRIGLFDLKKEPASFNAVVDKFDGSAIDISFGEELRNDISRSMIIGEQVHYLSYVDKFLPYFGHDKQLINNVYTMVPVVPHAQDAHGFWIAKNVDSLNISLSSPCFVNNQLYNIHELDIRCAMASFQSWLLRTMANSTLGSFNETIRNTFSLCVNQNPEQVKQLVTNASQFGILQSSVLKNIQDFFHNPTKYKAESYRPDLLEDLENIHKWLADLGNTYYGKQYLAQLNENVCFIRDSYVDKEEDINTEGQVLFSSSPTSAGGWSEEQTILGLFSDNPELDIFKTDDGRIKCFAKFNNGALNCGNLDIENISNDIITMDNSVWIGADIEEKIYLHRKSEQEPYRGYVVFNFNSNCVATTCDNTSPKNVQFGFSAPLNNTKKLPSNDFAYGNSGWGIGFSMTLIPGRSVPAPIVEVSSNPMEGIDHNSMEDYGFSPVAVRPLEAVIPMRSNVVAYGPWFSSNFWSSAGGADVSVNPDLAPWVFGSLASVNSVGSSIVEYNKRGLIKAESGSVTLPGLPQSSHGLPILGTNLSEQGPNLTSVNFSLGSKGATTVYEFKTYTPKFGKLTKLFVDRYKNTYKQRQNQLRLLRGQQANQNRLYKKLNRPNKKSQKTKFNTKDSKGMTRAFVGTMDDWYNNHTGQKSSVGLTDLHTVNLESTAGYASKAFMSLDGIFSPVSKGGSGGLPKYIQAQDSNSIGASSSFPPTNNDESSGGINVDTYDPLQTDHSIDLVGRGSTLPDQGLINSYYAAWDKSKYADDYRFICLRGPLILHSWGYDIDGNPVPAQGGSSEFATDYLQQPATWPVAPIDLRLDTERGLWVAPQPYKIISAILNEKLVPFGQTSAYIFYEKPDKNGSEITVVDKIGKSWESGTLIYAYYDTYIKSYIVLEGGEIPSIITGTVDDDLEPDNDGSLEPIKIVIAYTDKYNPYIGVGDKVDAINPMGLGANKDDYATAHWSVQEDSYIIINTGKPSTVPSC